MNRDIWYGREQFEINHNFDKVSNIFRKSMKSFGVAIDELSEAFKQLAKI